MFACDEGIWRQDDFTECFRQHYLKFMLPLMVSGISFTVLLIQFTCLFIRTKRQAIGPWVDLAKSRHRLLSHHDTLNHECIRHVDNLTNDPSRRQKDQPFSKGSVIVSLEILAAAGEIGINLTALWMQRWGINQNTAIAGLLVWSYLFAIVILRSLFTNANYCGVRWLWNHTVLLYTLQWLFAILSFRSTLASSSRKSTRSLTIADLVLSSILALIALTSRRKRRVISLEGGDKLKPSKEQSASLLSLGTFSWVDDLVWHGYKKTLDLADVWDMPSEDKTAAVLADFQGLKQTSTLTWRLLRYFHADLLVQGVWALVSVIFTFIPTILLQSILESIENPQLSSMHIAWICLVLLTLSSCIHTITENQALWKGRKICVQLRSIIIGEIYIKALRRKAFTMTHHSSNQDQESVNGKSRSEYGGTNESISVGRKNEASMDKYVFGAQADIGGIINLMAIDSFKISEIGACLHYLWVSAPMIFVLCILLLYRILGYSSLVSIGLMILIMPLSIFILRDFARKQKSVMTATDARMQKTNETLENIRVIKLFAWEQKFVKTISEERKTELRALRNKYILWAIAATIWLSIPLLITFFSFFIYTNVAQKPLKPSVAFTSLALFNILRIPLDQFASVIVRVQDFKVSIHRVENFLNEDDVKNCDQALQNDSTAIEDLKIGFQNASFSWVNKDFQKGESAAFRMSNINIKFQRDQLNVIIGPTGSGKTSLLMALLGEVPLLHGSVNLSGKRVQGLNVKPGTDSVDSVAYCAQQPWLMNGTIKDNILFTSLWNQTRYQSVLKACALTADLKALNHGDSTLVGERGVTLSGGQKQRIALARALYCNSQYVLLDDCLSAVDSETAKYLFKNCIMGPLMIGRTRILVTHNIAMCVPQSYHVVVLNRGRIIAQGDPDEVMSSGALNEDVFQYEPTVQDTQATCALESSLPRSQEASRKTNSRAQEKYDHVAKSHGSAGIATTILEDKAEGAIKKDTIRFYLAAMGSWYFWVGAFLIFVGQQLGSVATNLWLGEWSKSYQPKAMNSIKQMQHIAKLWHQTVMSDCLPSERCSSNSPYVSSSASNIPSVIILNAKAMYYPEGYALLSVIYLIMCFARTSFIFWGSLRASKKIHTQLLDAVMRAKFTFFDRTPLGRVMNRFSKDIESIDQEIASFSIGLLECAFQIITAVIFISVVTPGFLIAVIVVIILYFIVGGLYISSSRDLKRLESTQRSPLYQQFGETISGIITIRAFKDEARFLEENQRRVDEYNRPYIYLWATNQWLALRLDFAGVLVVLFAGIFILSNIGSINASMAGLSMTYATTFTKNVLWLIRHYASNEQNMNSVERVKEYLEVDREANAGETKQPDNWPSKGTIQFINYSTRYQPCFQPALQNITFSVLSGERVGVVGKTGAGKSSLILALFRGLEAERGKILIDDVDIGTIKLQILRDTMTLVPQDPTLFKGTIRSNIDPLGAFTDAEILDVLRRVQLIDVESITGSMESASQDVNDVSPSSINTIPIDENLNRTADTRNFRPFTDLSLFVAESGVNLSHGQRQMLCLGRALLKSPRILLLDEATASLDYATDAKIQDILRKVKSCTMITIAHRLQTIIDYDKVLVLDQGRAVEYDSPWQLITRPNGIFRGMCEISGDMASLVDAARKAQHRKS